MRKHIFFTFIDFLKKIEKDNVNAFSAQASFFIILSFFPFLMLLLTILQYTPIDQDFILKWTTSVTPDLIDPLIQSVTNELFKNTGGAAVISITAILALWSASRGILSIIIGLNSVFQVTDKRNYLLVRLLSCLYTIILLAGIILSLGLLVIGQGIYRRIESNSTLLYYLLQKFLEQKWLISLCILTLLFLLLYKALPAKKFPLTMHLPGAIFSAIGWIVSSSAFSFYISYSPIFSYVYGSLTTLIIFMLWMYILMYFLLLGAEINVYFRIILQNLNIRLKEKIALRKEKRRESKKQRK